MNDKFLKRVNNTLTNNFLGEMSTTQNVGIAIQNKYRANIKNNAAQAVIIALFAGHYPVIGLDKTVNAAGALTDVSLHYHDTGELTKGGTFVNAILDDATVPAPGDTTIVMSAADPTFTIRAFREYIRLNPMYLTSMTIHADNVDAYGGNLKLQKTNPFNRPSEIPVELDKFFEVSQFQDGKINIDFTGSEVEFSDDVLVLFVVPANSNVGVTFRLATYEEKTV
jgi:hypothetical protein